MDDNLLSAWSVQEGLVGLAAVDVPGLRWALWRTCFVQKLRILHQIYMPENKPLFWCIILVQKLDIESGYARVSTDGQTVEGKRDPRQRHVILFRSRYRYFFIRTVTV